MTFTAGILVGPTAVGKSDVAQFIAEQDGLSVISADSMLVYRGMDIGTAKPTVAERGTVPYFGIDCVDAGQPFSTGDWLSSLRRDLAAVPSRQEFVVAGGTGLYVKALLSGLDAGASDPEARARWNALYETGGLEALQKALADHPEARALLPESDFANPRRLIRALERAEAGETERGNWSEAAPLRPVAGLFMERAALNSRIARRIRKMFKCGLVEEAVAVRAECLKVYPSTLNPASHPSTLNPAPQPSTLNPQPSTLNPQPSTLACGLSSTACGAIGYAEALAVADGKMTQDEAFEQIAVRTRHLAKRQFTWFRHQLPVEWVEVQDGDSPEKIAPLVREVWEKHGKHIVTV